MKKISLFCTVLLMSVLAGCGKEKLKDCDALRIINEFQKSDYEYTKTVWNVYPEGEDQESMHFSGKVTENPYCQYELMEDADDSPRPEIGGVQQYYYEEDGMVFTIVGLENVNYAVGAERPDRFYNNDALEISYDREEKLNDTMCSVYQAQGTDSLYFYEEEGNEQDPTVVSYTYTVEFYLDIQAKNVVRIVVDRSEQAEKTWLHYNCTDSLEGVSPEEIIREKDVYDISNQGGSISIDLPKINE